MQLEFPETFNLADWLLDARDGSAIALRTDDATLTYDDVRTLVARAAHLMRSSGVQPEQRIIIALPDGPEYVAALLGALKIGAVVVMVNPHLRAPQIRDILDYSRAVLAWIHAETAGAFREAATGAPYLRTLITLGEGEEHPLADGPRRTESFPTHRDDPAIWLFSGGTSGQPKAVVQTHRSYANTTVLYGQNTLGLTPDDITISVPKLFFGYAMGSNLFFPFSVGASAVLFPERCTPDAIFERIARHRPTVLINVPTMVQQMLAHPDAAHQDLSSLRLATSAGEALAAELHERWTRTFNVELLDGLGTAEMWHIFLTNQPGDVKPGTLGRAVTGFDVRVRDESGRDLPAGEVGFLWVRGDSRAIGYWQNMDATRRAFRGEWYVSEDMLSVDEEGYFSYCGRADDMLKVSGKWLAPQDVENCLLQHPAVREVAVVGVADGDGLVHPHAYVVGTADEDELRAFVRARLESYKVPRAFVFMDALPRTHLGKIDRGRLRQAESAAR